MRFGRSGRTRGIRPHSVDGGAPAHGVPRPDPPRALVTGAATGIGRAVTDRLVRSGARVVALDRDRPALAEVERELGCDTMAVDLGQVDGDALGAELLDRFGPISLVVNNAGVTNGAGYLDSDPEAVRDVFAVNLFTHWFCTRRLCAELVARGEPGAVVWLSSLHDHRTRRHPAYSASKAALAMLVVEMAAELGPVGIRVNAVSPGWVTAVPQRGATVPLGRSGAPDDVAEVVEFLLSDRARYVTGANWPVDGGLDTHTWITG